MQVNSQRNRDITSARSEAERQSGTNIDRKPAFDRSSFCIGMKEQIAAGKTVEKMTGGYNPERLDRVGSDPVRATGCGIRMDGKDQDKPSPSPSVNPERRPTGERANERPSGEKASSEKASGGNSNRDRSERVTPADRW